MGRVVLGRKATPVRARRSLANPINEAAASQTLAVSLRAPVSSGPLLTLAAAFYLVLFLPLVVASRWMEHASGRGR